MKANKMQSFLIVVKSLAITLWISLEVIVKVWTDSETRQKCDHRLRWWAKRLLRYPKLSYTAHNPHQVRFEAGKPYLIMSNHSSLYDIPLIFATMSESIRMLTKKELFEVPVWGRGMREAEFISIDRNNRRQALLDLQAAQAKMTSGIILWVAPEGTRSQTGDLGSFKKGGFMLALKTGATIVPVGIRGAFEVLPPKTLDFELGRHAEVHIGRPVDASTYNSKNRDRLMEEIEEQIRGLAAIPKSQAS